jgi:hypothetical protein
LAWQTPPVTTEGPVIRRSLLLFLSLIPAVVACSAAGTSSLGPADGSSGSPGRPTTELSPPFETAPATNAPVTGEVPADVMAKASADLAARTGLDPSTFTVVRSEQVQWPDGSLGCPVPGQMYTQMVTPGYWIILEAGGTSYDYRATATGVVRRCDQPNPLPSG